MQHRRLARAVAHARELLDPRQRVEHVAAQEVRAPSRPGRHSRLCLWHQYGSGCGARGKSRSKWVVRRAERAARASTTRSTSACSRPSISARKPSSSAAARGAYHCAHERARAPRPRNEPGERVQLAQLLLEREQVVARGLHAHEQRVERGDVHPGRVVARLERLHERRARAGERVEHAPAARHEAAEQHLDELRDELAEVRVEPVHVLRPHALGQVALGPREGEVDLAVEGLLRRPPRQRVRRPRDRVLDALSRERGSARPGRAAPRAARARPRSTAAGPSGGPAGTSACSSSGGGGSGRGSAPSPSSRLTRDHSVRRGERRVGRSMRGTIEEGTRQYPAPKLEPRASLEKRPAQRAVSH